jgi:hypothetical protein
MDMSNTTWNGSCIFSNDLTRSVALSAGTTTTIPWPE